MRIYKTKLLARIARRQGIKDRALKEAIDRAGRGLIDADLGGNLIKQRVARLGQGRSGGYRTVIAYQVGQRAVFLYSFAKNERDNIDDDQLRTLQELGAAWLKATDSELAQAIDDGSLKEVEDDDTANAERPDKGAA